MDEKCVGIIPSPDFPASTAEIMKDKLAQSLSDVIDRSQKWSVEIQISSLIGSADHVNEIIGEGKKLKNKNGWDFAVCLTDLPVFAGKQNHVVLADISTEESIAHISLPAFGAFPTPKRTQKTVVHVIKELYVEQQTNENIQYEWNARGKKSVFKKYSKDFFKKLNEAFRFSPLRRISPSEKVDSVSVRFVVASKLKGWLQTLLGMSVANRPWTIMPSFKNVVALAFASGAYGLIFPTLWQVSISYGIYRFVSLMFASILAMVVWIVFAHNLWEKKMKDKKSRLRPFYNAATIITLTTSILMYYFILFIMFLTAVFVFVPPDMFSTQAGHQVAVRDYVMLAWLVTSVATVAGAIGSGLEKTEQVAKITYGYRQYLRSEQVREDEKKEEEEKQGKTSGDE